MQNYQDWKNWRSEDFASASKEENLYFSKLRKSFKLGDNLEVLEVGFGNGRLLPSGPLRENIYFGLSRAQAVVIMGNDHSNIKEKLNGFLSNQHNNAIKVLEATIVPKTNIGKIKNTRLYAFSGIGHPKKFFDTLERIGCCVIAKIKYRVPISLWFVE